MIDPDDELLFPEEVPDVGNKTFLEAYTTRASWVEFTLTWTSATGFFQKWFEYVKRKKHINK